MKNYFIVLCFLVCFETSAQIKRGAMFVSGSVTGFSQTLDYTQGKQTISSTTITPGFGFFLSPTFAIGAGLFYTAGKTVNKPDDQQQITQTKNRSAGFTPFARYYIPITNNFFFALHGQLTFGSGKVYPPAFAEVIDKTTTIGMSVA